MMEESTTKLRNLEGEEVKSMDRISMLPDCLVHRIYSFLPHKDVVKTTRLSKLWHSFFLSYPNLDFDQQLFNSRLSTRHFHSQPRSLLIGQRNMEEVLEKERLFIKHVNDTLLRFCERNLDLEKFRLSLEESAKKHSSLVDKWMELVVNRSVKEICLDLDIPSFKFSQEFLSCNSIRVLHLCSCDLKRSFSKKVVHLTCLIKLVLERVKLNELVLKKLLKGCPSVSEFIFEHSVGLKKLSVSGLEKLKILRVILPRSLTIVENIHIQAPVLESLTISGTSVVAVDSVTGMNLKSIFLDSGDYVKDDFVEDLLSKSPVLENLILNECYYIERINISSHRLRSLTIAHCGKLKNSKIDAPNLHTFEYMGKAVTGFSLASTPCCWRIHLYDIKPLQLFDLKCLFGANKIKDLTLSAALEMETWFFNKVSDPFDTISIAAFASPCCEVDRLSLQMNDLSNNTSSSTLINGMLYICRPKILSVPCDMDSVKFIEILCKMPIENKDRKCCSKNEPGYCWRHCLEDVKIEKVEKTTKDGMIERIDKAFEAILQEEEEEESEEYLAESTRTSIRIYVALKWISDTT